MKGLILVSSSAIPVNVSAQNWLKVRSVAVSPISWQRNLNHCGSPCSSSESRRPLDVISVCTRPGQHVTDRIGQYQPQVPGAEFGLGVRWSLVLTSVGVPEQFLGNPPVVVFSLGLGGVPEGSPVAGQLSGTLAGAAAGAAAGGNLVATPGVCACGAWSGAHRGGKTRRSPGCDLCLCDRCMHNRSLTGRTRPGATTQVMWE